MFAETSNLDIANFVVAIAAIIVSVFFALRQIRDSGRMARIEEARRRDEESELAKQEAEALVADVRVLGITFVQPGNAGDSDRLELTVENRGPASARNIDVALKDTERDAQTNHLREVVEFLDEDSGGDRVGYFRIGEGGEPPPLSELLPGDPFQFQFWHRTRLLESAQVRLAWEDGRGLQVKHPMVKVQEIGEWSALQNVAPPS